MTAAPTSSSMSTADLIAREQAYVAKNYKPLPVVLTRGEGSWLWDAEGKKYLDFLSAYSAVSAGHQNQRIVKALIDQITKLDVPSRAFYTDKLGEFARRGQKRHAAGLGGDVDLAARLAHDLGDAVIDPIVQAVGRMLVVEADVEGSARLARNHIGGVIAHIQGGEGQC